MKSRLILIFALFLTLTSFRSDEKAVKQSDVNIFREVNADYQRPEITSPLRSLTVIEGQVAVFEVRFTGSPVLEVTWFKNGREIKLGGRFKVITEFGISILTIDPTYLEDEGDYSVRIRNQMGEVTSTARLKVLEM